MAGDNIGCLYGYHHAESDEFRLTYSQDARESKPVRLLRRALKAAFGFDFIHTWRNRDEMLRSDVIWTHTEQEWLSAALMLLLSGRKAGAGVVHDYDRLVHGSVRGLRAAPYQARQHAKHAHVYEVALHSSFSPQH